jgi:phosphatidylserine/phosphatidylglycerophosphate/cardiolipin synthase-like enzyme
MTKRRSTPSRSNTQRLTLGGVTAVVIFAIVLIAQLAGIDVLGTEEETGSDTVVEEQPGGETEDTGGTGGTTVSLQAIPGGYDGGWFQIYFTEPINSADGPFEGSPLEKALVAALDGANTTIDASLFELNSQPVTDALVRAKTERGVQVRIVTDGFYGLEEPEATFDQLEEVGIPVIDDGSRGARMHDKFFVIDGLYVWTGSTNITHNGIYNNNNNAMLIRSSQLAQNYTTEFEELFSKQFGVTSPKDVPNPSFSYNDIRIETFFESEGDVVPRLAELVSSAHSLRFMTFSFTANLVWDDGGTEHSLVDLILTRAQAGELDLQGIIENSSRAQLSALFCAGLDVRRDGNKDVFHHKVFIIDESIVVMGSFNFSDSAATSNDENVLIIHSPAIAQAYLEEFGKRWDEAVPVPASEFDC